MQWRPEERVSTCNPNNKREQDATSHCPCDLGRVIPGLIRNKQVIRIDRPTMSAATHPHVGREHFPPIKTTEKIAANSTAGI